MLKKILIGFVVLLLVFCGIVAMQPNEFRVSRSATFQAPAATVFAQINDLHCWEAWSPWAKLDPAMKQTYEGPASGVGASNSWAGNADVGEGRMTITESRPNERIQIKLEFLKPFAATSMSEFTFQETGGATTVTWTMTGANNFIAKAFCLFMDMDAMIGADFEKGLANMKSVVESGPK